MDDTTTLATGAAGAARAAACDDVGATRDGVRVWTGGSFVHER